MRFELDTEANALYIYFREIGPGEAARTVEIKEGVNLDIDAGGRTLGLEFVDAGELLSFLEERGGTLDIPDKAEDLDGFGPEYRIYQGGHDER